MTKAAETSADFKQGTRFLPLLWLGVRSMFRHPVLAVLFLASTFAQGVLQGGLIWALRNILRTFSGQGELTIGPLALGATIVLAIWLARAASFFVADVLSARLAYRVEVESMWEVLGKLLTLPVRFFEKSSQGDLVMSSYYDLKGIRSVTLHVGRIFLYLVTLAGLAVAAWMMSPKLAVIGFLALPVAMLPAYWLGEKVTSASRRERETLNTLYDTFLQVSSGIQVIKVNRQEGRILEQARPIGWNLYRQIIARIRARSLARFLLEAVSGFGLIMVLVLGGRDVASGALDWQSLLSLMIAVMAVYQPVVGLLQTYTSMSAVVPNIERVDRILGAPATSQDGPDARPLRGVPDTIELRDVSFAYDDTLVLDSISGSFRRGQTIGIVGPSGAGKSTLMALMLRFYEPTSGSILFDGVDIRDLRHADVLDKCAIVLQEPFLFVDTVMNNIRFGRPYASAAEVIEAAKAANIHDEIMAMERGYETVLGRGISARGLSVGQKQRVCIAAALIKDPAILFLDEATSNLDSVSERQVQEAIDRLMEGRTTFVIAHRISTLQRANKTLVLDKGRLVGVGTHPKLRETCTTYRELCAHQGLMGKRISACKGAP